MILLTLARYILECSLLDYTFVTLKDSLKAAASLYLAFKMCNKVVDAKEFFKYTGNIYILFRKRCWIDINLLIFEILKQHIFCDFMSLIFIIQFV